MNSAGQRYCDIIKNPLCFRDIVYSLVDMDKAHTKSDGPHQPCGSGILSESGLVRWDMWRGFDLLQAIDLVFLNALAFNGKEKTRVRSQTNRLRRILWDEIQSFFFWVLLGGRSKACYSNAARGEEWICDS